MKQRQGTVQPFTLSATAQLSSAFGSQTDRVVVTVGSTTTTGGAFVLFGDTTSIAATSTNATFVPVNQHMEFDVTRGQRMSTIEYTTTHGILTVTELS